MAKLTRGYPCPECDAMTRVIDARRREAGDFRRRRSCPKCGHRFTTIETICGRDPSDGRFMAVDKVNTETLMMKARTASHAIDKLIIELYGTQNGDDRD